MGEGKIAGLIELGTGFNFEISGLENLKNNALLMGMSKKEITSKLNQIIGFAEIGSFIHEPLKTYSSGMVMRLAFSTAIHTEPHCFVVASSADTVLPWNCTPAAGHSPVNVFLQM